MATSSSSSSSTVVPATTTTKPPIVTPPFDPRFKVARALVTNGRAELAVEIFATLLQQTTAALGDDHIRTAPLYHEYGNALFRVYQHEIESEQEERNNEAAGDVYDNKEEEEDVDLDTKRTAAAAAAEKRFQATSQQPLSPSTASPDALAVAATDIETFDAAVAPSAEPNSDLELALEMLETGWAIYDAALDSDSPELVPYQDFVREQIPRVLGHLGDVLLECKRYADAVDARLRALKCHEDLLEELQQPQDAAATAAAAKPSLEILVCRRKIAEDNILIAETLLACPSDAALVTTETKTVLVPAGERVSYAQGYYDAARSQLQETVLVMGQLAGKNVDLGEEKENICFASTLLMSVGLTLSDLSEADDKKKAAEPSTKKAKTE